VNSATIIRSNFYFDLYNETTYPKLEILDSKEYFA